MRALAFAGAGLIFGSFLTVVVHRVPRKESIVRPGSACPRCGTELRWYDNVPVLSWLVLRGRCRACGAPVSAEYPLTEGATALLFVAAGLAIHPVAAAAIVAPFLGLMLAVALIDARHRIVPNALTYPAIPLFAVAIVVADLLGGGVAIRSALLGLALYAGPLFLIALAVPGGMGMGDVKLAALIGLVLGALSLSHVAVAAGLGILSGGVGALVAVLVLGRGRKQQIPFGPFLAGGAVVGALAAPPLARAYLGLFLG